MNSGRASQGQSHPPNHNHHPRKIQPGKHSASRKASGSDHRNGRNPIETPRAEQSEDGLANLRREAQKGVGIRIRAMREAKGWPQDVLARKCGICPGSLGEIERGHKNFRLLTLLLITKGLETTIADLLLDIA